MKLSLGLLFGISNIPSLGRGVSRTCLLKKNRWTKEYGWGQKKKNQEPQKLVTSKISRKK